MSENSPASTYNPVYFENLDRENHFNRARAAYDNLAAYYKDLNHLQNVLANQDLIQYSVYGTGFHAFKNAILQYATGNHSDEDLVQKLQIGHYGIQEIQEIQENRETQEIQENRENRETQVTESMGKWLDYVKTKLGVNLLLFLIRADYENGSVTSDELGSFEGHPVVVLNNCDRYITFLADTYLLNDELSEEIEVIPNYNHLDQSEDALSVIELGHQGAEPSQAPPNPSSISNLTDLYDATIESFKKHLFDLANPILVQSILHTLRSIPELSLDFSLSNYFQSITIPQETQYFIHSLNKLLLDLLSAVDSNIKLKSDFLHSLHDLADKVDYEDNLWEELKVFFRIPQIITLPNASIKKILYTIHQGYIENLRDLLEITLKIHNIDSEIIDNALSYTEYEDLPTLLAQIVESKPMHKEDILTYWHKSNDFFIGKTLNIHQYDRTHTLTGYITKCTRTQKGDFILSLDEENEVQIYLKSDECDVKSRIKHYYPLWSTIEKGVLNGKEFKVQFRQGFNTYSRNIIVPGTYKISSIVNFWGRHKILLTNLSTWGVYHITLNPKTGQMGCSMLDVYFSENEKQKGKFLKRVLSSDLDKIYLAVVEKEVRINCDPKWQIVINNDKVDEDGQAMQRREIQKEIEGILLILNEEESRALVDDLLEDLIKNNLQKISLDILKQHNRRDITDRICDISKRYWIHLNLDYSSQDILKQVVIDSNYANLINKSQSVEVSKAMELLRYAYDHIANIENKDIVMFIGNTGSGKSTAINYFLGAEVEYFINKAGDKAVKIKNQVAESLLPKIGQALTESETLYTQGFSLPASLGLNLPESIMLADCPGFNDTRGGHYELCSNLSIDQSIEKARSIKSIIITVPIQAFTLDRANHIIELIETIKERFPTTFDPDRTKGSEGVFILITKSTQVRPEVIEKIKNGTRFQELLYESNEKIRTLMSRGVVDEFELDHAEKRHKIWKSLQLLHEKSHIDIIDIRNKVQKKKLLRKYCASDSSINKTTYQGFMKSREMQSKFGKYIEMYAHTWTHLILNEYFVVINNELRLSQQKIEEASNFIEILSKSVRSAQTDLLPNQQSLQDITIAEDPHNPSQYTSNQVKLFLLASLFDKLSIIIHQYETMLTSTQSTQTHKTALKQQIDDLSKLVYTLSSNSHKEILYEKDYRDKHHEHMILLPYTNTDLEVIYTEIGDKKSKESSIQVIKVEDLRGKLACNTMLHKKYRLTIDNPELRPYLEPYLIRDSESKYQARIEGEGIDFKLRCQPSQDSKYTKYMFYLNFVGDSIPWIRIYYEIVNTEYNEATILNQISEINRLKKDNQDIEDTSNSIDIEDLKESEHIRDNLEQLNRVKDKVKQQIDALESDTIEDKGIHTEIDIQKLNELLFAESEMLNSTKVREIQRQDQLLKKKKHIAIIIKSQIDMARFMRNISEMVTKQDLIRSREDLKIEISESVYQACTGFIETYDSCISKKIDEFEDFYM